jgi:hypothetical protein
MSRSTRHTNDSEHTGICLLSNVHPKLPLIGDSKTHCNVMTRIERPVTRRPPMGTLLVCFSGHADPTVATDATATTTSESGVLPEVTVTAERLALLGTASTASEGAVDD